jgi:nucleoid DNA-binding protein
MTIPTSIIQQVKQETGLTVDQTRKVCDAFMAALISQVKSGKSVSFKNCVTFKRVFRGDRNHKNPKTGDTIFKKAHYVISMDVKPALRKEFEDIVVSEEDKEKEYADLGQKATGKIPEQADADDADADAADDDADGVDGANAVVAAVAAVAEEKA